MNRKKKVHLPPLEVFMKIAVGFIRSNFSLLKRFLVDSFKEQVTTTKSLSFNRVSKEV